MKKLEGKVALVTGSGRGIGREVALQLAAYGAKLVINDLDAEPAEEVVATIRNAGGEAVACVGSVTAPDFAERLVKTAVDNFGAIDIIVNNAGFTWDNVIQKMSDEQWYAIMDCHLTAPFRILRAAQPVISAAAKKEAAEGREVLRKVVNISSGAAGGNVGQSNYSSAKAGMLGLTKTLAKEWGRLKVNVNAVAFGLVETRLTQALAGEDSKTVNIEGREIKVGVQQSRLDSASQTIPLGRPGKPEEAAGAVVMFCLPESDYCSGQVIYCGGGPGSNF
ncbi:MULTISPECIES: SDR family NAD(P)-dependent oxidoreductase [Pseudomonas]|jgi:3-oxoacyl-[acyl-carrier protein] reductase|uniref:SDR family NAD(P)-dependent oxidoreductase n=1 Tax=Pseudomonas TaxID=286 RepID=UPI00041EEEEC|nr:MULTISPECIES: SDR family NAD(P)-dependent oxidoreductase [Pseudomonas]MCW2271288.1 3-oxoacyl-[acyl-carrier protein] reductase [Pseudomonas sp. JUb96]PRA71346.1 3-oxoacyl-ACP reductase [Pseudomonas sp. MYb187]